MNCAIRYYTRSKKGNTKKLADYVSNYMELEALDITNYLDKKVDTLFLINAMYAFDIDEEVKHFLENNKDNIGLLVNINSAASGASTLKSVKKVADKLNIAVSEKEYHTVASWIFINKGRPNEDDFNKLEAFIKEVIK